MSQQLYAKIKKSSKYFHQNKVAQENGCGLPFEVRVDVVDDAYCVAGGPGGRYRLSDINLFVMEDGKEMRIT